MSSSALTNVAEYNDNRMADATFTETNASQLVFILSFKCMFL